jgi:hypothetical protein
MSEPNVRIDAPEIRNPRRPIIPRAERARRSWSWWIQASALEGWDRLPEFEAFQKAGFSLLKAIDKRVK